MWSLQFTGTASRFLSSSTGMQEAPVLLHFVKNQNYLLGFKHWFICSWWHTCLSWQAHESERTIHVSQFSPLMVWSQLSLVSFNTQRISNKILVPWDMKLFQIQIDLATSTQYSPSRLPRKYTLPLSVYPSHHSFHFICAHQETIPHIYSLLRSENTLPRNCWLKFSTWLSFSSIQNKIT